MRSAPFRRRVLLATLALAGWSAPAHAHRGRPLALATARPVGPYIAALWSTTEVGTGTMYVVLTPRAGTPFTAPSSVRLVLQPTPGAGAATLVEAHAEPVSRGARYVAHVDLDHAGAWRVDVALDGAAGSGTLAVPFEVEAPAAPGAAGMLFYASPFILVAGLWVRARLGRRPQRTPHLSPVPSP